MAGIPSPKLTERETKKLCDLLYENRREKSVREIAREMGIKDQLVVTMAKRLRKLGLTIEFRPAPRLTYYSDIISEWRAERGL